MSLERSLPASRIAELQQVATRAIEQKALLEADFNQQYLLDLINRKIGRLNDQEWLALISCIESLIQMGKILFPATEKSRPESKSESAMPNELGLLSDARKVWTWAIQLLPPLILENHHALQTFDGTLKEAHQIAANPRTNNETIVTSMLKNAAKLRSEVEGCYLDRKESRILRGLLLAIAFLGAGAAFFYLGFYVLPAAVAVMPALMVFYLIAGPLAIGSVFSPILAVGAFVTQVCCSAESKKQEASRELAVSLKSLAKSQQLLFSEAVPKRTTERGNVLRRFCLKPSTPSE